MRVPLSWLQEFTPLDVAADDAEAVARLRATLDGLGLVVEGIEIVGGSLDGVLLARVLEINGIEGADRVRQVFVDAGDGRRLEIVCGATNFALGDVVPLATIGTALPSGMVIAERKMRGATSKGMLCSGRELGIDDDADGLLILASPGPLPAPVPDELVLGRRLDEHLGQRAEVVFDIAIEPNRPDCLSIIGIARDLAAKLGLSFSVPDPVLEESGAAASTFATVTDHAFSGCPAIVGRVLSGVEAFPSPELVRHRLELCGMRPINALVDASNYVMLEFGQPTHPYDLDRLGAIGKPGLVVRFAEAGEILETLDGEERLLGEQPLANGDIEATADLVIADGSGKTVVGLAGIMGGAASEIGPETSRVLLESASFDPLLVGATSARLGLRSEASVRFWRGTDPAGLVRAADRYCQLVQEAARQAGATIPLVAPGVLEARHGAIEPRQVIIRVARVNALLGTDLAEQAIVNLISPLGFHVEGGDEGLLVTIPTWRPDASREVDVIEEVARHYSYERIGRSARRAPGVGALTEYQARRRDLRRALVGAGVDEAWTSSLVNPEAEEKVGFPGPFVEVTHPIVHGERALRVGLLSGLLGALAHNEAHRNGEIRLFEIGNVFGPPDSSGRPVETTLLGVLLAGHGDDATSAAALFATLTEAIGIERGGYLLDQGGERNLADEQLATGMHATRSGLVMARRADPRTRPVLAAVGEVDPEVLAAFGIGAARVGWIAASLEGLFALPRKSAMAKPVSRYPSSDVDLAFVLDEEVPAARLREQLERAGGALLTSLRLIDVYRGAGVPSGTRSLTYRLRLGALDHTLTDAELAKARTEAIKLVESRLPARLRA